MSPTNKETADLIRRVRGASSIPPQAAMPNGGTRSGFTDFGHVAPYDPTVLQKATQEGQDLSSKVVEGGTNAFGYTIRVISGLQRGVTNLAAGVLPHANNIWDTYKDGFQFEDVGKTAKEAYNAATQGAWGAAKGIAVSGVPIAEELIKKFDDRPIYEWGADLFKSDEFSRAMNNLKDSPLNAINEATPYRAIQKVFGSDFGSFEDLSKLNSPEYADEKVFGGISIPFTPIQNFMPLSRAETYGLGWDITTDPTTYATMGLAGAIKGGARGISSVAKYQKSGKAANFADIAPQALPRPYYGVAKGGKKVAIPNPTYTVMNTSPITYIVKEMGRGFTEAHKARLHYAASKKAALQAVQEYQTALGEGLLGKEGMTPQYVEEFAAATRDRVLQNKKMSLIEQGITDPMEIEKLVMETTKALEDHAAEVAAKAPEIIAALSSKEAAANIQRIAEENGITPIEASVIEIANATSRGLRRTSLAIPRTKNPKINAEQSLEFSRAMKALSEPDNINPDFGGGWDVLAKTASTETLRHVFDSMAMPIGYREKWAAAAAQSAAERMSDAGDLVRQMYGLSLSPMAAKSRKPATDLVQVDQRVAKGITRATWVVKNPKELNQIMKMLRQIKSTREGAGSKTTLPRSIPSAKEIIAAPQFFLDNLTKNYYEDVVRKTLKNSRPWDELYVTEKATYAEQIIADPSLIPGSVFQKSLPSPTLMSVRIEYMTERSLGQQTAEYTAVEKWKSMGYNPVTLRTQHPKLYTLVFDRADKAPGKQVTLSEVIRLTNVAAGRLQDPVLNKILYKLGVNRASLHTPNGLLDMPQVEEILHNAHTAVMAKERSQFLARLQVENTGELGADALVDPTLLNIDMEALLGQHIADLQAKGRLVTSDEIKLAVEKLADIQEAQIAAKDKLAKYGFDPLGAGSPAFGMLTKFDSPVAKKSSTTEARALKELKAIVESVKDVNIPPEQAYNNMVAKLSEIMDRPNVSALIKNGIKQIIGTGAKARKTPISPDMLKSYFSLIGNIIRQVEDKVKVGTTAGYDVVFSKKGGEYDQQAIDTFLEQAYRASKSQDSLDGGYFADQIEMLAKKKLGKSKDYKPLREQSPEEVRKTLQNIGPWNGEGMSASLLQTIIRFTERQTGRVKSKPLTELEKQDIQRSEDALYEGIMAALIKEEEKIYLAERKALKPVTEDTGEGRMIRVAPENLQNEEEVAVYESIVKPRTVRIDSNGEILGLLNKFKDAVNAAIGQGYTIKVPALEIVDKTNKEKLIKVGLNDLKPGDELKYKYFLDLSLNIQKSMKDGGKVSEEILRIWQITKELSQTSIARAESRAGGAIVRMRARKAAEEIFPKFASAARMTEAAAKITDKVKAGVHWRARAWIGTFVVQADSGIRDIEKNDPILARLSKVTRPEDGPLIEKEKALFIKIVKDLRDKYLKEGYKASKEDLTEKSIQEVIAMENPIDFLRKITTMIVKDDKEAEAWGIAMGHLSTMTVQGKPGRYDSFAELIKTYKSASREQKPGDISIVTGKQIPTDKEVLQVLSGFDETISEAAMKLLAQPEIRRNTVLMLLKKLDKTVEKADLEDAQTGELMARIHAPGADQIQAVADNLPDPKIMQQELVNQFALERVKLHNEGLGWLEILVAEAVGKENKQFILDRFETHTTAETDLLGRTIDVNEPKFTPDRSTMKRSYETTSVLLTGWKKIVGGLSEMATAKGLAYGTEERMQFMTEMALRALRLRDMHLNILGIFPSSSWRLKRKENIIVKLNAFTPEEAALKAKPAYLSDADILDIFPQNLVANMLFVGPMASMPITAFAPAASLLVTAMDTLKAGSYFSKEELNILTTKMAELMRNDASFASPIAKGSDISHYGLNAAEFEQNIRTIVAWMVEPENAFKLWDQHVLNAAYASKIYKYKSGKVTAPIIDGLLKMFSNSFASVGNKIEAVLNASEELRKLTGRGELTEEVLFQAELDLNAVLAAHIDRDSFTIAQEALRIEAANASPEGQAILASQRKAANGNPMQQINAIRLQTAQSRDPLYMNLAGMRNLNEAVKAPQIGKDDPFDVFHDHLTAEVRTNLTLKFGEKFGRLFFDYGMEKLRPLYGPHERNRIIDVSLFEQIGANMKQRWSQEFPDRNILGEAWQIIQRVPAEVRDISFEARAALRDAAEEVRRTGKQVLTPDQYAELIKESKKIDEFLSLDDEALNRAVSELWSLGGRIFSGGEKSMLKRYGLTPSWLNRNLYEVGGGNVRAAIDPETMTYVRAKDGYAFRDAKSMAYIWQEWEIDNPIEMIVTMNAAIQRAQLIPTIADDAVRKYGIQKSFYKNAAEAKKDGLVAIKTIEKPQRGRELVYFMDTENYYYPIEVAQELKTFSEFLGELKYIQGGGIAEKVLRKFSELTNVAKSLMTILRPGNYVQNGQGGVWVNAFAGTVSPMAYGRAIKTMQASGRKADFIDLNALEAEMGKYEAMKAKEGFTIKSVNDPRKTDSMLVTIAGKAYPFSYSDLEKLATKHGIRVPVAQNRDMDLVQDVAAASSIREASKELRRKIAGRYNKIVLGAGKIAAQRDEALRLTLFLDELGKNNWKSLEAGAVEAMKKVDRYHPQVQDLSTPLQKARPFLMFITWKQKMMATVLGDLLQRPGPMLNSIRVTQASNNSQEQSRSNTFGNLTPGSVALPEDYKYNLDPIAVDPVTGMMTRYSLANPVTDLYGSNGLLTGINFNTYEPFTDQLIQMTQETANKLLNQSYPFVLKALWEYPQGRTTSGQQLGANGFNAFQDAPPLLKDIMVSTGLNPAYQTIAAMWPWLASGKSAQMSGDQRFNEVWRAWTNFATGAKLTPLDTIPNRNRGMQELLDKLKALREMP
jgi:hypothetical protein